MYGLFFSLLACQTDAPADAADWPDPDTHLPAIKSGLDEALLMWQGAQPAQAQALLEKTYREHFEPFEPALIRHGVDPLPIEYDFGRIGWRMRRAPGKRSSEAEAVSALLTTLQSDIEVALSVFPDTAGLHASQDEP